MAAVAYESLEKGLFVIERTRRIGRMTVSTLARFPGWNKPSASRYLSFLSQSGWLERVNSSGRPLYVLGPKLAEISIGDSISIGGRE